MTLCHLDRAARRGPVATFIFSTEGPWAIDCSTYFHAEVRMPNIQKVTGIYSYMQNPGNNTPGRFLDKGQKDPQKPARTFKEILKDKTSK